MPAQVRSEFLLALNQVAAERNISLETIIKTIEDALLMAYRKDRQMAGETVEVEGYTAEINSDTGEAAIFVKNGDGSKGGNVTPPGFGRIAAQTAGQVLRQRIREAEKKAVIEDFTARVGTITNGTVLRFDGPNIMVDISRAEAVMPPQEQNPAEHYRLNQRLTFYIEGIRESARGQEIVVSRAHKNLVVELFRREVPEVQSGAVEIKLLAREAGGRTKLAVVSAQSGVDPVGACVGQKGVRVQAVINELGGMEKVDIIQYTEDVATLIASALAPAKDIEVILTETSQSAIAVVPDDQLSLAIGREGQNVRLAAKLTGWKIDIKGKMEYSKKDGTKEDVKEKTEEEKVAEAKGAEKKEDLIKDSGATDGSTKKSKKTKSRK
ncbi:MAG: NusA antitermination factor [Microgenomates group bacterium GW2011_GWA1_48_10]|uniref:Transcription termination/antitermination protein NusA n=1 Tax=Candidatus Gottesmanbacteria bacterium RIFCSPHIGHO2_01_FULL_47_48 TaxID=1798381 RepID=A0A1F6A522_9BACT|nr:MAG: NusA antitermination factor [Microgenomates group bacterium GW2011_GWA1_48_10]OGG19791.1 MAG: transcription termination factor NusA [Candidatus Gottesmanbacteria bacterium RIFCSPHIGHO2_01_FULL_47_48]